VSASAACLFCRIIREDEPAHVVFADDAAVAILDVRPLFVGHALVMPRNHHETLGDLPTDQIDGLFARVRRLSTAMESHLGAQGSFVAMNNRVSQSVPHLHVHVVPRTKGDGLRGFFWPRTTYADDAHATATAATLAAGYHT
jgi:histidine triad (HIT) family protein